MHYFLTAPKVIPLKRCFLKIIVKIKRTTADITDYKYFDNITIPKSKNPQSWPIHDSYNNVNPTEKLDSIHSELGTVAFLIIKNDSIWHEKYYEGYNENSLSNSFSISKSIVAAKIGKEAFLLPDKFIVPLILQGPFIKNLSITRLWVM